ncbi:MAG: fibronectin type III domain-containing protein [Anaerolineae bacterium]|nr:fibronectin type III domain-containing protein [Anaerolineae bacterium]
MNVRLREYTRLFLAVLGGTLLVLLVGLTVHDRGLMAAELTGARSTPRIEAPYIQENYANLHAVGLNLFYSNTAFAAFSIGGNAYDAATVTFSTALGQAPPADVALPPFAAAYDVAIGITETGVITATAFDITGSTAIQTYTYVLDGEGPVGALQAPEFVSETAVLVQLQAVDAGCGVADMCLSAVPTCTTWEPFAATRVWMLAGADGVRQLYVRYRDFLGNVSGQEQVEIFLDRAAPVVTATAPAKTFPGPIAVSWQTVDAAPSSGIVPTYTVAVQESGGAWHSWLPATTLTRTTFASATPGNTYVFSVTVHDEAGNLGTGTATTIVENYEVFLPLLIHSYAPLSNGDFGTGTLTHWNPWQGGFGGAGSGLPQSVVVYENNSRALLGDRISANGAIPVGYGGIAQTFTVERRYLEMRYRIFSYDVFQGSTGSFFDTFEVSLDASPEEITYLELAAVCVPADLNPDDTVVADTGLVFCGGRDGVSADLGTLWDSGWITVTLDLESFLGDSVTLYLTAWGREYEAPFYDDHGWYSTWVYVDDLVLKD